MANNVAITPGTGDSVAAEDISSVKYQLVKLVDATSSSTTRTGVAASPLQVSLANTAANSTAVKVDGSAATQPVSGTVAATQSGTWTVQPGNTANTTAWKVDGSAVTQPVSGTVSITANSAVNVAQMNGVTVTMGNGIAGTGVQRVTVASDNTPFPVKTDQTTHGTTDLVAADVTKIAGTAVDSNSGTKSAGTLRVVLATDQPQLTNKLLVTPDANSAVNVAQMNGVAVSMGVGATGTGVQRTVVANDAGRTLTSKGGTVASSGNNTIVVAGTNKLKVYAFTLSTTSSTEVTCIFQSGASGTELWRVDLQAPASVSTGANLAVTPPAYLFSTASATLLNLNISAAQTIHYSVSYFDEA